VAVAVADHALAVAVVAVSLLRSQALSLPLVIHLLFQLALAVLLRVLVAQAASVEIMEITPQYQVPMEQQVIQLVED
jgi:hypothetical protein